MSDNMPAGENAHPRTGLAIVLTISPFCDDRIDDRAPAVRSGDELAGVEFDRDDAGFERRQWFEW